MDILTAEDLKRLKEIWEEYLNESEEKAARHNSAQLPELRKWLEDVKNGWRNKDLD